LLVSELPLGTGPRRHHFPRRNRLISALSSAVLVVEAAWASGSLITARWAADQGRAVFALPGRIDHPMARGCHRLIREGATLVDAPEQVLEDLGWCRGSPERVERRPSSELERALVGETLSADELAARTRRDVADVLTELVELELLGAVARAPGGLYRAV
jgi:DNA processing protein